MLRKKVTGERSNGYAVPHRKSGNLCLGLRKFPLRLSHLPVVGHEFERTVNHIFGDDDDQDALTPSATLNPGN